MLLMHSNKFLFSFHFDKYGKFFLYYLEIIVNLNGIFNNRCTQTERQHDLKHNFCVKKRNHVNILLSKDSCTFFLFIYLLWR